LYTSFQNGKCFYASSWEFIPSIDAEYGLQNLAKSPTPEKFWEDIRKRLVARATAFIAEVRYYMPLGTIIVAGEAATHPDFRSIVQDVAKAIPQIRVGARGEYKQIAIDKPSLDVFISEDPAFAAARGAALLQRLRVEASSYCWDSTECCNQEERVLLDSDPVYWGSDKEL
jgi:hypothetical protein